jgi:hypothetical protein
MNAPSSDYGSLFSADEVARLKESPNDPQAIALLEEKLTLSEDLYRLLVDIPQLTDPVLKSRSPSLYSLITGVIIDCIQKGDTSLLTTILAYPNLLKPRKDFFRPQTPSSDSLWSILTVDDETVMHSIQMEPTLILLHVKLRMSFLSGYRQPAFIMTTC